MLSLEVASKILKANLRNELSTLSPNACHSKQASRLFPKREKITDRENIRSSFFHDTDKIIHSLSYSRYIDKTQVFYLLENDHITHRILHVQLVSKIGRVIGRCLQLNEDLIEAIALGHDIGHSPFGHNGEKFLDCLCQHNGIGHFVHNAQSVRFLSELENKGKGLNLTLQVMDGILCHNGEHLNRVYEPKLGKNWDMFLEEYHNCFRIKNYDRKIIPTTLEGCVVRISDVIAYIGRDIEDAITLKLIKREDIPEEISSVLGNTNDQIVNKLVVDLIENSYGKKYLEFSSDVFKAFDSLKKFNYNNIYNNPKKMAQDGKIEEMFKFIFKIYLNQLKEDDDKQYIVRWAKKKVSKEYHKSTPHERIVVDYISGMTDDFLIKEYKHYVMPESFGYQFKDHKNK